MRCFTILRGFEEIYLIGMKNYCCSEISLSILCIDATIGLMELSGLYDSVYTVKKYGLAPAEQ